MTEERVLLDVRNLRTHFVTDAGLVKAVDDLSFTVRRGEVFAIVGESGSGKSVTSLSIMGLLPDAAEVSGTVLWKGKDLLRSTEADMRKVRGAEIAMVFQDALTAMNPVFTVGEQIMEMVRAHRPVSRREARVMAVKGLEAVGIPRAEERFDSYPHEFSGGMRQRAMIAMAIACEPELLIADEPTTALDVTVQSQVLEVMEEIKERTNSAIMLITHDLGVVAGMADRVMVMYAGRSAEEGSVDDVFYRNRHPYSLGLLASLPRLDESGDEVRLQPIPGQPPSLLRLPSGCPFHPRCPFARLPEPCATVIPPLAADPTRPDHRAACHFADEVQRVRSEDLKRQTTQ